MTRLKRKSIAAVFALGALALVATPAVAHGPDQDGYGAGMGMMMGHNQMMTGAGMMGPGHSPGNMGMMGPGYGMMGQAYGHNPCGQVAAQMDKNLDIGDVQARLERWLAMQDNDRLKLGKIEAVDVDTITVEIVTVDDSLVQKLVVDRRSGQMHPAK
jgi:hypothetical protein